MRLCRLKLHRIKFRMAVHKIIFTQTSDTKCYQTHTTFASFQCEQPVLYYWLTHTHLHSKQFRVAYNARSRAHTENATYSSMWVRNSRTKTYEYHSCDARNSECCGNFYFHNRSISGAVRKTKQIQREQKPLKKQKRILFGAATIRIKF